MKSFWSYLAAIFILLVIQTAVLPPVFGSWPIPSLVLILLLLITIHPEADLSELLMLALVGGLMTDFLSSAPFGLFTVGFMVITLLVGFISRQWFEDGLNFKNILLITLFTAFVLPFVTGLLLSDLPSIGFMLSLWLLTFPFLLIENKIVDVRTR